MTGEEYNNQFSPEELDNEIWKDVGECEGYGQFKGLYEISSLGRLRSLDRYVTCKNGKKRLIKGKLLKPGFDRGNYAIAVIQYKGLKNTVKLHRLVLLAFLTNPDNLPEVNHIDENTTNNRLPNLEWCTKEYNINYGKHMLKLIKPVLQYTLGGRLLDKFSSVQQASKQFEGNRAASNISKCLTGVTKTAYGYIWKYADE